MAESGKPDRIGCIHTVVQFIRHWQRLNTLRISVFRGRPCVCRLLCVDRFGDLDAHDVGALSPGDRSVYPSLMHGDVNRYPAGPGSCAGSSMG